MAKQLAYSDEARKAEQQKRMLREIKRTLYKQKFDVNVADKLGKDILNLARSLL